MLPFHRTRIGDPDKIKEIREKLLFMKKDFQALDDGRTSNAFEKPITVTTATAGLIFAPDHEYWISDKSDGQTYNLMLFRWSDPNSHLSVEEECSPRASRSSDEEGCAAVLVDEKYEAHSVSLVCNPAFFDGSLFVGELMKPNVDDPAVINDPNRVVSVQHAYLAFGVFRIAGKSTVGMPFSETWKVRSKFLPDLSFFVRTVVDPVSQVARKFSVTPSDQDRYEMVRKKGFLASRERDLLLCSKNNFLPLSEAARMPERALCTFLQCPLYKTEPWGSAMLTPERKYVSGDRIPFPLFKFKNRHTFDFEIETKKDFPASCPLVRFQDGNKLVPAELPGPSVSLYSTYQDEVRDDWPVYIDSTCYPCLLPETRDIWECELVRYNQAQCYIAFPKNKRPDKPSPNARGTVVKTMETLDENMTLEWLLAKAAQVYGPGQ